MRRGRPSLLGTMARTAVISGTATRVSTGVAHRQAQRHQAAAGTPPPAAGVAQPPAPAAVPQPEGSAPGAERIAMLKELGELKAAGVLTEEEFTAEKARLLGS